MSGIGPAWVHLVCHNRNIVHTLIDPQCHILNLYKLKYLLAMQDWYSFDLTNQRITGFVLNESHTCLIFSREFMVEAPPPIWLMLGLSLSCVSHL